MGRGIVHPVDVMANEPWSEDLLDYLAIYLVDHGYDLKAADRAHRQSRAYQSRPAVARRRNRRGRLRLPGPDGQADDGRAVPRRRLDGHRHRARQGRRASIHPPCEADSRRSTGSCAAALVKSDPLMRSLGRPNREQVVTTRSDMLTTLEALDLSNGQVLDRDPRPRRGRPAQIDAEGRRPSGDRDDLPASAGPPATRPPSWRRPASSSARRRRPEGLADLLWVVFMLPEFQLIR